jgi:hypothetical protein
VRACRRDRLLKQFGGTEDGRFENRFPRREVPIEGARRDSEVFCDRNDAEPAVAVAPEEKQNGVCDLALAIERGASGSSHATS